MKKISIVVQCHGIKDKITKCIESIIKQSMSDIEILAIVNNTDKKTSDLINSLNDKRIKVIESSNTNNKLLNYINITKNITGDYISFIDVNDYLDKDYYRLIVNSSINHDSEIVISNLVRFNNIKKYIHGLTFNTNNAVYEGKDFFKIYIEQTGRNIRYNFFNNKIIRIELWNSIINLLDKIKINIDEQIVLTTLLLYYSKKISFCDNAIYYLHEEKKCDINVIDNKIKEINNSFDYINEFLKKEKCLTNYKKYLDIWNAFYIAKQIDKHKNIEEIKYDYKNDEKLNYFYKIKELDGSWNNYNELETEFLEDFNKIKEQIMNPTVKIISFDMFDTLITRPFFLPHEMFVLLNKTFIELFDSIKAIDFSIIRRKSENEIRDIKHENGIEEVTLDDIYDHISNTYNLDKKRLNVIKNKEMEMELTFCKRRNSGYELYSLAKCMNKKVILTSDIYLPKELIIKILDNTGYDSFDELYISSELLKTKSEGTLYKYIIEQEKTNSIFHIGDNYETDYKRPKEYNLLSAHLPKTSFVMMGYTGKNVRHCGNLYRHFLSFDHDHIAYEENYGVRCALGVIANYYFDNPFIPFNTNSDFNGDPYFIGYYALGMQLISMCKWLLDDAKENNIDSIAYMARDGYLPYLASKIFIKNTNKYKKIKLNYTYVSRKSLMPLLLKEKSGISLIETYVNYDMLTPKDILEQLKMIFTSSNIIEKEINKEFKLDEKFTTLKSFNECLSLIYDKCFDKEKYNQYFNMCKKYFDEEFEGNTSTFDIGYSGKPEAIISSIINKPIRTYFIHTNNSSAFNNLKNCNSKLVTFYEYKPTITGTIRELFVSSVGPTCIGYKYDGDEVKPIFKESEKYNYFNIDMINKIQQGALDFVDQFSNIFKDYIDDIDLNKYYMSIPLEYYYHYTNLEDRLPTKNQIFENNVNNYIELNDYIFEKYKAYKNEYSLGKVPMNNVSNIDYSLPNNRIKRVIYYTIHDRKKIKDKWIEWSNKKNDPYLLPNSKSKRIIYYMVFDRKKIIRKVFKQKDK